MDVRTVTVAALLAAFAPAMCVAALPAGALVHAGDKLHVEVVGEAELTSDVVVAGDGTIGLPLVGQVRVAGVTPNGASQAIAVALKPYVRDPRVSVDVAEEGVIAVSVFGDVVNSGAYKLRPGSTLSAAITAAGGLPDTLLGAYPVARVANTDGTTYHISLDLLLRGGDPTRDVVLRDGSAVYVPGPVQFDVAVLGAVDNPGTIAVNEGDRLSIAVAKAGNSINSHADLNHISVSRTEPNGTRTAHSVNLYEALERGDTRYDPVLRKNDVIFIPMALQSHGNITNAVFLLSRLLFFL